MDNWINKATEDLTLFRLKHLEALRSGLIDEETLWRRWLV